MSFNLLMHHIVLLVLYIFFCVLTCNLPLVLFLFLFFLFCCVLLVLNSSTMPRKTRANKVPSTPSMSPSKVQLFRNERCREAYKKLNSKRKIWAERSVILDEVDPAIRANLESRDWLSLLEINHPPPTALLESSSLTSHVTYMILISLFGVGYEVLSSPLPLG